MDAALNEVAWGEYLFRTFRIPANHISLLKYTVQKQRKTVWERVWQWKIFEKHGAHLMLIYASWFESVLTLTIYLKCHNVILNKAGTETCGLDFYWDKSGLKISIIPNWLKVWIISKISTCGVYMKIMLISHFQTSSKQNEHGSISNLPAVAGMVLPGELQDPSPEFMALRVHFSTQLMAICRNS